MHPNVVIGNRCRIYHHVTFAAESVIGSPHRIILGDDVTIGAHSVVIARSNTTLTIGNRSTLGAGSVLTKSIPDGEIWAGTRHENYAMPVNANLLEVGMHWAPASGGVDRYFYGLTTAFLAAGAQVRAVAFDGGELEITKFENFESLGSRRLRWLERFAQAP